MVNNFLIGREFMRDQVSLILGAASAWMTWGGGNLPSPLATPAPAGVFFLFGSHRTHAEHVTISVKSEADSVQFSSIHINQLDLIRLLSALFPKSGHEGHVCRDSPLCVGRRFSGP